MRAMTREGTDKKGEDPRCNQLRADIADIENEIQAFYREEHRLMAERDEAYARIERLRREIAGLQAEAAIEALKKPGAVEAIALALRLDKIRRLEAELRSLESRVQQFNDRELKPLLARIKNAEERQATLAATRRALGCSRD